MKTVGDFFALIYDTQITEAKLLFDEWREVVSVEEWVECEKAPLTREAILTIRSQISALFAERLEGICTDALYRRIGQAHTAFIMELDEKAGRYGLLITEKRSCVTPSESARNAGMIQITTNGISLTPKGLAVAKEVGRQIGGSE